MQQRQLRLGDTLDDYCPRERRVANHTIVAMVGDDIRLTRCTTCETEHPYKGGKAPRLRKKKTSVEAAYDEVLESVKKDAGTPATKPPAVSDPAVVAAHDVEPPNGEPQQGTGDNGSAPVAPPVIPAVEEARLHRPLIRAQLPRVEREPAARPVPQFTIRQANKRQGRFQNSRPARFAKTDGQGNRPGNTRGPGGPQHGVRQGGRPQGPGSPSRPGGGRHSGQHSGKKRSR